MTLKSFATTSLVALVLATASGCASYRVSSNVESTPAPSPSGEVQILLAEDNLPGRDYAVIGPVEVSVKKLTVFHKNPTRKQANEALIEKARALGANAVINIKYTSGIGFTTWGYMDAKGTAVKLVE
jgi:hypothetical protein